MITVIPPDRRQDCSYPIILLRTTRFVFTNVHEERDIVEPTELCGNVSVAGAHVLLEYVCLLVFPE
jgi:hypothetical protein